MNPSSWRNILKSKSTYPLCKKKKMNNIAIKHSRLQFITNQWSHRSIPEQVEKACTGGCRWIQLRLKDKNESQWLEMVGRVKPICHQYGAFLILNDHVEMALKTEADGVHLGKEDMCPAKARQILGENSIIGGTANTLEDIRSMHEKGVDYIGLGPFRFTPTKKKLSPVLGIKGYRHMIPGMKKERLDSRLVAVGGIEIKDIPGLMETGIHGVAISSAFSDSNHPETVIQQAIKQTDKEVKHAKNIG